MTAGGGHDLTRLIAELSVHYSRLLELEREKTGMLTEGLTEELSSLMNEEQAVFMKCRACEKLKAAVLDSEGGVTLRELVAKKGGGELLSAFSALSETALELKKVNERNIKLAEVRLSTIRTLLKEIGALEADGVRIKA